MVATKGDTGVVASDFRVDVNGFSRILVCDLGLTSHDLGAPVQRVLQIETYRPLALLGLSAVLELAPASQTHGRQKGQSCRRSQNGCHPPRHLDRWHRIPGRDAHRMNQS